MNALKTWEAQETGLLKTALPPVLADWNAAPASEAARTLLACCGSTGWVRRLVERRPFDDCATLCHAANNLWFLLDEADWLEAFACHPRIGQRVAGNDGFAQSSRDEQATAQETLDAVAVALAAGNHRYETRFGFTYIVYAQGRTAPELLHLLEGRLRRDRATELHEAARQQGAITRMRIERWLGAA